jgi:hypothetical protein
MQVFDEKEFFALIVANICIKMKFYIHIIKEQQGL